MIEESWDTQLYMHSESDSFDRPISEAKPLALGDRREWWHQIVRKIRRPLDLEKICQQTVDELGKAFDISRCIICLYKSGDHQVSVVAEYRQEPFHSLLGKFLEVGEEPGFSEALASLEPVVVQLTRTDQDRCEQQSILVIATYDRDRPNGIISLQHCLSDSFPCPIGETKPLALGDRQWSEEQIELVRELGDVVGSAIAHVQLYKKWEEASYQAQEASRLKNEFLGTISHELRTPLNKIICSLKLILDDGADDPEEQREFINYAHHSALHLLNLINDILEISKLKSDKIQLDIDPINFAELLNDLERCLQPQMQGKNLNLLVQNPSHNDIILYGNYRALLQVLLNLVDNAIKFTEEGGITISSRVIFQKVIIHNHELPGLVEILITDTGIGVSLEKQEKIFTMFTKGDGSRTSSYGGTGLGLTLCQKLLAAMGGEITFSSRGEGLGSTVTFTVPLYQEPVTRSLPNEASEINLLI